MKNRLLALSCLCVLVLNLAGSAVAVDSKKATQTGELTAMLPAVDGVVAIDVKRFMSDSLPKLLSANPTMLGKVTAGIEEMKADSGVDFRQFDRAVVGVNFKKPGSVDVEPIVIARGTVNASTIIASAKQVAGSRYREEKVGDKTIHVFSPKVIVDQARKQAPAGTDPAVVDKVASKLPKDIAVAVLDPYTIAFGEMAMVRKTIGPQKGSVSADLTAMLAKNETAVVSFAGKMPGGMKTFLPMDNDELGRNIDSIRFVYGNLDVAGDSLALNVTARTLQDAQAKALLETLEGLQIIGKAFLGGSKGADKQVYARLIENAKFSAAGNELNFSLQVPQSDIDVLVSMLK